MSRFDYWVLTISGIPFFYMLYTFLHPLTTDLWQTFSSFLIVYSILFTTGYLRYDSAVSRLESKINNLVNLYASEGKLEDNKKSILERVPFYQRFLIPVRPNFLSIKSVWKSINPKYDAIDFNAIRDLNDLVYLRKHELEYINLSHLLFLGRSKENLLDMKESKFDGVLLNNGIFLDAYLHESTFKASSLIQSAFFNTNLSFSDFNDTNLAQAQFIGSDMCKVKFHNSNLSKSDFSYAFLVGADLTNIQNPKNKKWINEVEGSPVFKNAVYNSQTVVFTPKNKEKFEKSKVLKNCEEAGILNSSSSQLIPPTKFPEGFDPKKHGMIELEEYNLLIQNDKYLKKREKEVEKFIVDWVNSKLGVKVHPLDSQ